MSVKAGRAILIALMIPGVLVTLTPAANANLIANGDFEACSSTVSPGGGSLSECGWLFSNSAGVEGSGNPGKAMHLKGSGSGASDPTAQQTVGGLTIGESYTLSWDRTVRYNFGATGANGPFFGVWV